MRKGWESLNEIENNRRIYILRRKINFSRNLLMENYSIGCLFNLERITDITQNIVYSTLALDVFWMIAQQSGALKRKRAQQIISTCYSEELFRNGDITFEDKEVNSVIFRFNGCFEKIESWNFFFVNRRVNLVIIFSLLIFPPHKRDILRSFTPIKKRTTIVFSDEKFRRNINNLKFAQIFLILSFLEISIFLFEKS